MLSCSAQALLELIAGTCALNIVHSLSRRVQDADKLVLSAVEGPLSDRERHVGVECLQFLRRVAPQVQLRARHAFVPQPKRDVIEVPSCRFQRVHGAGAPQSEFSGLELITNLQQKSFTP